MGRALEVVTFQATAPGGTLTAAAALTGNSLTVRDSRSPIRMVAAWSRRQSAGQLRLISPLVHDNVVGMTFGALGGDTVMHASGGWDQALRAQDTLSALVSGSATAGDIEQSAYLVAYDDLPGVSGNFIDEAELMRRMVNAYSSVTTLTGGATGQYSGSEGIAADMDALKANTEYALLGYTVSAGCCTVRYASPDFGNLGVGGPGISGRPEVMATYFLDLSRGNQMPLIPVFNSSNKGTTLVDIACDENAGTRSITHILVELSSKSK